MPWEGLAELREMLRQLPEELTEEASTIVHDTAVKAADAIVSQYPRYTGNLKKGVRVSEQRISRFGVMAVVENRAKHAWIFEYGTQARHFNGQNRGVMPAGHVFIPNMEKFRREMYEQKFRALLERAGLTVTME